MARFTNPTANGTLSPDGMTLSHNGRSGAVANVLADVAIDGKQYYEVHANYVTIGVMPGMYGGTSALPTNVTLGNWYNQPGAAVACTAWNAQLYANDTDTNFQVTPLPGTSPQQHRVGFAVDAATRRVWVRFVGLAGWVGGGDPTLGTNPTFVLGGTTPIFPAAGVSGTSTATLVLQEDQEFAAPSGFTEYMGAAPPDGAIEGSTTLAFAATGTLTPPPAGMIAGTTSFGLATTGTLTPPPGSGPVLDRTTANGTISPDGRGYAHNGGAGTVANSLADTPFAGRQYLEFDITRGSTAAAGAQIYGGTSTPNTSHHFGVWYGQPGAAVQMTSAWNLQLYANTGLPGETSVQVAALPGTPNQTVRVQMALDATTRQVWVRRAGDGWLGGGDPAAGTSPSLVLEGTDPIYPGANSSDSNNVVRLLTVAEQVGAPPAGFTNYMGDAPEPPDGELEGAASVTFAATATPAATGALTGTAAAAFAATAAARARGALAGATSLALATTGTAHLRASLAGATTLAFAADGTARARSRGALAGSAGAALTTTATLAARGALASGAELAFAATGTLHARSHGALAGSTGLALAAAGAVRARASIAGSTGLALTAVGDVHARTGLAGSTGLALAAAGGIHARARLVGTTGLTLTAAGAASARASIAGSTGLALTAQATASQPGLTGTTALTLSATGTLHARAAIAGQAGVALAAAATPRARGALAGSASLTLAASADTSTGQLAGTTALALAATASAAGTGALAGTAAIGFEGSAQAGTTGALSGTARVDLGASATGRALAGMAGQAALTCAVVGALLGRVSGTGATGLVLTPTGLVRGTGALAGTTALALTAVNYPGGLVKCPPRIVVYPEPGTTTLTYAPQPPVVITYDRRDPGDVVLDETTPIRVVVSC